MFFLTTLQVLTIVNDLYLIIVGIIREKLEKGQFRTRYINYTMAKFLIVVKERAQRKPNTNT